MPPSNRPSSSRLRAVLSCLAAAGVGVAILGCSSDTAPLPPPGFPRFAIDALLPAGGHAVPTPTDGACVELGRDPDQTITVVMFDKAKGQIPLLVPATAAQQNFTLLPPFACVGTAGCGYLQLTVDPGQNALIVASASISIDVPMARLKASPLADHQFVVELQNSDGTHAKDAKGKPLSITLNVHVAEQCGDASAPIPDSGAPEAGPDATSLDGSPGDAARDAASPDGPNPGDAAVHDSGRITDSAPPPTDG